MRRCCRARFQCNFCGSGYPASDLAVLLRQLRIPGRHGHGNSPDVRPRTYDTRTAQRPRNPSATRRRSAGGFRASVVPCGPGTQSPRRDRMPFRRPARRCVPRLRLSPFRRSADLALFIFPIRFSRTVFRRRRTAVRAFRCLRTSRSGFRAERSRLSAHPAKGAVWPVPESGRRPAAAMRRTVG